MLTREEVAQISDNEKKQAFQIVESIMHFDFFMIDNFYSGDKDTLFDARECVASRLNITEDEATKNHKELIEKEFNDSVEYGKRFRNMYEMFKNYSREALGLPAISEIDSTDNLPF